MVSVPLVLLAAGHLKNDGPAALARARMRHPDARFRMARDLGIHPVVLDVAEERIREALGETDPAETAVVLVGRGSSDPDAGADLYKVARLLADGRGLPMVEPAFIQVAQPDVPTALERCRRLGATTIVVAPFLLFTGRAACRASTARRPSGPRRTRGSTCGAPATSAPTAAWPASCSSATARR